MRKGPFQHPLLETVIIDLAFKGRPMLAASYPRCFDPIPLRLIAFACTLVRGHLSVCVRNSPGQVTSRSIMRSTTTPATSLLRRLGLTSQAQHIVRSTTVTLRALRCSSRDMHGIVQRYRCACGRLGGESIYIPCNHY